MLDLIGDALNWAAAGLLFPLMLLPLAAAGRDRGAAGGTGLWLLLVAIIVATGCLFVALAPRMSVRISSTQAALFSLCVAAAAIAVAGLGGPRRACPRLARAFEIVTAGAGRIVMWLTIAMALVQFTVVIMRYVFGVNFLALQESTTYMHGAVFLLAAGYALLTNDQVRVDIFYREAPPRRKALIDLLGTYLLLFPVCLLILWTASSYVGVSWSVREGSQEQSGIQAIFLVKSLIPAFATLLAMAGFVIAARAVETLSLRSGERG
jgi:TRAP-type mannitol/chloroaromatic compound transport system permease small subunit